MSHFSGTAASSTHLRTRVQPDFSSDRQPRLRMVDLFAGCGGLTLGVAQSVVAAGGSLDVRLAVDFEPDAVDVYRANFPFANAHTASVESFFDGELGARATAAERLTSTNVGEVDLLVGGPPCQGHSDLNNRTRRADPKNELYLRMARATEILRPSFVVIENVPTVRHDTAGVVDSTIKHLRKLRYKVEAATLPLHNLGVAQKRRRHVILASKRSELDPEDVLSQLLGRIADPSFDLKWAIGDLEGLVAPLGYDTPPVASAANRARMQFLLENEMFDLPNSERPACHQGSHSYKSMYGRLKWSEPAQTITSGFGSIGQGRYMHPSQPRALTAHEAARIQGFPDYFRFDAISKRTSLATMIGNAVPPALMREIAAAILPYVRARADGGALAVPTDRALVDA